MTASQSFTFDNQAANITVCSRQMLDYLDELLTTHGLSRAVKLRAKFIIAELLNNAVKHSGTHESTLAIALQEKALLISKTDEGKPFDLVTEIEKKNAQLMVSSDAMHLLYAVKKEDNLVSFYCKENLTFELDVNQLAEHLGLLIITKSADEFTYRYHKPVNVFCAQIKLG
ncbi:ATP-binding protein [Mucilaginibacter terrae]|uniref:Anti-sigma regulatory factor (Ser/Thr protein kinase) n=1 Tax=Mucilaginibacter terrae TaxID=1955052 RepID=A0ABU3GWR5_9SPHI|nr:ATP-binding protein [Mucilaginibacter terrae]MDT3404203.1 anti-sigma regulatory factor (Ser/Thr protein kinase) [Mucilaginibacter terrae]